MDCEYLMLLTSFNTLSEWRETDTDELKENTHLVSITSV